MSLVVAAALKGSRSTTRFRQAAAASHSPRCSSLAASFSSALQSLQLATSVPGPMNAIFNQYNYVVIGNNGNDVIPLYTQADSFSQRTQGN